MPIWACIHKNMTIVVFIRLTSTTMAKIKTNKNDLMLQLFVIVDDLLTSLPKLTQRTLRGRKRKMSSSEIIASMIFWITVWLKNISDLHRELSSYFDDSFDLPCYKNFVSCVNNDAREGLLLLCAIMQMNSDMSGGRKKFIDATSIAVCKNKREFTHKVAKNFAYKGKSTMGRFYGFKLHIIVDENWRLLSFSLSPGNTDDRKVVKKMVRKLKGLLIADAGYVSEDLAKTLNEMGIIFLTGYRKNMKKLVTQDYIKLTKLRQIVETWFWMMKCWWNLVSSYARSLNGHMARIIYNLLQYSVRKLDNNAPFAIS